MAVVSSSVGAVVGFFFLFFAAAASGGEAALVEHTFVVSQIKLHHLCNETLVTVVNGQLPGPAIEVTEGDSLIVHVINKSPSGLTIHWHGVKQMLNCWADGPVMVTQCPIQPGKNFTYRFNVVGQEGTLWWHAHVGCLRATVHGALIIRPRSRGSGSLYPFPKPHKEIPIVIGEWWEKSPAQLEKGIAKGDFTDLPRSATINGKLGDLNNCSGVIEDNYILDVVHGKTYLLRLVNAGIHSEYYLKIAGHTFTVVAADANYVKPYTTDTVVVAPGETVDAMFVADAPPGRYYMVIVNSKTIEGPVQTRGIVNYIPSKGSDDTPILAPKKSCQDDESTSFYFHGNLTSLPRSLMRPVPMNVDEQLFVAIDTGYTCEEGDPTCGPVSCMNNISFQLPATTPLLQDHYYHNMSSTIQEFPRRIPPGIVFNEGRTSKATSVRRVRYNTTVEIVFQGPPDGIIYSNPMHLHGHDFFVLAQGIGKYDAAKDVQTYNLVDPPMRNTALVPISGWTAIRFVANNPGVWFLHCHFEKHVSSGMGMVLIVENGPTSETTLPPPPADFPSCDDQNSGVAYE